ncbi:hypothetical protein L2E82_05738 [Cichorium intybus]|uniref:Uncharacterized protein n=1 Tax=Cichorium intybus TaxID=13427 RepID=A0ACB9H7L7_CICIN|nr:hypothetical protein L2E82_05738 [Cichorium intybus]
MGRKGSNFLDGKEMVDFCRWEGKEIKITGPKIPNFEHHPARDFRSYSVSYASSYKIPQTNMDIVVAGPPNDFKLKKGKSTNGSVSNSWSFSDPEFQRKKRVEVNLKVDLPYKLNFCISSFQIYPHLFLSNPVLKVEFESKPSEFAGHNSINRAWKTSCISPES